VGKPNPAKLVLSDEQRERLKAAIERYGFPALVEHSGASRESLLRAVSGLGIRLGTFVLIERVLTP
jgi:hypothetical protein